MYVFVYFANKRLGHQESFFMSARYLTLAAIFIFITITGFFLKKKLASPIPAIFVMGFPYFLLILYGLFMIAILISSKGRWN